MSMHFYFKNVFHSLYACIYVQSFFWYYALMLMYKFCSCIDINSWNFQEMVEEDRFIHPDTKSKSVSEVSLLLSVYIREQAKAAIH